MVKINDLVFDSCILNMGVSRDEQKNVSLWVQRHRNHVIKSHQYNIEY